MINKKEKYLKNYLNYEKLKKSLNLQQNKFIELYTKDTLNKNKNISPNIISSKEIINSENILPNIPQNNLDNSYSKNNIYKIRLDQSKQALIELSQRKWPNITIAKNILDLKGNVKYYLY